MSGVDLWNLIRRVDLAAVLTMLVLMVVGLAFIFSAHYHMGSNMWIKQIVWCAAGLCAFLLAMLYDFKRLRELAYIFYGLSVLLLLLLPFFGKEINSAKSWYDLGVFTLQPSELLKPAMILALAAYLSDPMRNMRNLETVLAALGIFLCPFVLIALQPDPGTASVLIPVVVAMMFIAGLAWRVLGLFFLCGIAATPLAWLMMGARQKNRILTFLDPSSDPTGAGWNLIQSRIAVASGGLDGKGFLQGTQNILGFLPETVAPTDFIFSVITEEMGFIGSAVVLGLFGVMLTSMTRTALRTNDQFGRLIVIGVLALMFSHVTVNVAMTVGLMPIVGLPLPLVSYGGSFMISMMLALGLVQSVHVRRP